VLGYPPLWRAINLISDHVACLPFDVYKRKGKGDREWAEGHPGNVLMRGDASEFIHGETVRKTLTSHAALYGNGFATIDRDSRRKPIGLYILDPLKTGLRSVNEDYWYFTWVDGEEIKIHASDMLHIKGLSSDGMAGISVISLMRDALGVGMAAQQYGGRFFGQGSNAGGILMVPGAFSEEKIRNTIAAWEKMTQGLQQSHKVALLQDGVKFQQLTVTNDQAQFLQTRAFEVRSTVANIFGIPPHKLGDDTRTSHNSLEAENQSFLDDCLNPWLKEWERECRRKLLTDRERKNDTHFFEFNREALVQMAFRDKVEGIYRQIEMGLITRNEGRRILNMPDIGEEGEKRFHPANWVVDGEEKPVETGAKMPAKQPQSDDKNDGSEASDSVLRSMIASSVTKSLQIEKTCVVRAAKMQSDFCGSLDEIYSTWTGSLTNNLGWKTPEAMTAIQAHCEQSKKQLLETAGVSTTATLENNVRDVVACWDGRGEVLINNLFKAAKQ
jgi:HK97 family phage portal protein